VDYIALTKENNYFDKKRNQQNKYWLLSTIDQQLKANFYQNSLIKNALSKEIEDLENGKTTPFNAAKRLLEL
jgi:LAO/AO transport system kinase